MPVRTLFVDEQEALIRAFSEATQVEKTVTVVGAARGAAEALTRAKETVPEVAVVDVSRQGEDRFQAVSALRGACPQLGIVAVTLSDLERAREAAAAAGADVLLAKTTAVTELAQTICALARRRAGRTGGHAAASRPTRLF